MSDYNIPENFEELLTEIQNENTHFSITDEEQSGDNIFSMNLLIESVGIPEENIVANDGTRIEIKTKDMLFEISAYGGGDFHIHNYDIDVLEFYDKNLELDIIEEKEEHEIYAMVQRIHPDYDSAFIDGDLGLRIEEFPYYHLKNIDLEELDDQEWLLNESKVDDYVKLIKEKGLSSMPALVIDDNDSIIDGLHRLNALKQSGVTHYKVYVGSQKSLNELVLENFLNKKKSSSLNIMEKIKHESIKNGLTPIYHSADISISEQLKEGLEPFFGKWLEEVLSGAVDDDDFANQIREENQLVFYDETPRWVSSKVARAIGKTVRDVTWDDIENHGHVAVVLYEPEYMDVIKAGNRDDAGDSDIEQVYFGTDELCYDELPFGVEQGDLYTRESYVPDFTITGKELVSFLKNHFPNENIIKDEVQVKSKRKLKIT